MHEFGSNPKTRMLPVALSVPFHYIRYRFFFDPAPHEPKEYHQRIDSPAPAGTGAAGRPGQMGGPHRGEVQGAEPRMLRRHPEGAEQAAAGERSQEYAARYHAQEQERRIRDAQTQSARKNIVIIAIIWLFVMAICFSAFAFREQFKHQFGMTPTEYRQNL